MTKNCHQRYIGLVRTVGIIVTVNVQTNIAKKPIIENVLLLVKEKGKH